MKFLPVVAEEILIQLTARVENSKVVHVTHYGVSVTSQLAKNI